MNNETIKNNIEKIKLRHELILCAQEFSYLLRKYENETDGNPFTETIEQIEAGLYAILFLKGEE